MEGDWGGGGCEAVVSHTEVCVCVGGVGGSGCVSGCVSV